MEEDTPTPEEQTPAESQEEEYKRLKEQNNKVQEELIRAQRLRGEALLGGENGGNITSKELSEAEQKTSNAKEYWKGTALEDVIKKANE